MSQKSDILVWATLVSEFLLKPQMYFFSFGNDTGKFIQRFFFFSSFIVKTVVDVSKPQVLRTDERHNGMLRILVLRCPR